MRSAKTILVVDDEGAIRRIIERKLANAGYRTLSACDGEEALALIRDAPPDLVITDGNMPRLGGRELCEKIDPLKKEHPFLTLLLTGRIQTGDRQWAQRMQDTVLMEKPFSLASLLEFVDRHFGESP